MSETQIARPGAVVFDIGRVLYEWDLRFLFAGVIDDQGELDWFLAHVVTEEWHFQSDAGRPLAEMLRERKALFPGHAALIDLYHDRFLDTLRAPVPGTHALVEQLAARAVPLYALSNFSAEFWQRFRPTAPIFDLFSDCVISGVEKMVKPDPRIYALAEQRTGLAPRHLLFVDDRADNIAAAAARGWDTHLFTGARALERALRERGLID